MPAGTDQRLRLLPTAPHRHKVVLGGQARFRSSQFAVTSPSRAPIATKLFTAEEILSVAPKAKVRQAAGHTQVLVTGKNGRTQWVGIEAYIDGLNKFETFLNSYGYTLRDGPLSGAHRRMDVDTPISKNLGLRFQLLPPPGHASLPPKVEKSARTYDLYFKPEEMVGPTGDPTINQRGPGYEILQQPQGRGYVSPFAARASRTSQYRAFTVSARGVAAADLKSAAGTQAAKVAPTPAPAGAPTPPADCGSKCTLQDGDYVLSDFGQQIYDNALLYNTWHCSNGYSYKGGDDNPCYITTQSGEQISDNHATKIPVYAEDLYDNELFSKYSVTYEQWKIHYKELCAMLAALGNDEFNALYKKANPNAGEVSSAGTVTQTTGQIADNFYDGTLDLKVDDIKDCLGQSSDNSWFSASICAAYGSDNHYSKTNGFNVSNTATINSHVSLFGLNYTLLDGTTSIEWHQKGINGKKPADEAPAQVDEANEKTTLDPKDTSTTYDGPSAVIPIGPVPLTITSSLTTELHVGDPQFTSSTPAYMSPFKGQDVIGVGFGAGAGVHVTFDAGIDVVVASAGVEGKLDLVSANATGGIQTTIDTTANDVTVDKSYALSGHALAGTLSAYVEIDLLVYSKRWSVDLASFDGIPFDPDPVNAVFKANAVLPGTGKSTANCN